MRTSSAGALESPLRRVDAPARSVSAPISASVALSLGLAMIAVAMPWSPGTGGRACAQTTGNFNAVNFVPIGGRYRVFAVEEALVSDAWVPYAHILFHGERDSLMLRAGNQEELLVSQHHFVDLNIGVGLFGFLQLDVGLPIALAMEQGENVRVVTPSSGPGLGDLVIRIKGTALDNTDGGFGVGISAAVTVPTGDPEQFRGDEGVGVHATLILDYRWDIVNLAFNTGVRARTEPVDFVGETFDHDLTYGLGVQVSPWPGTIDIGIEAGGKTRLLDAFQDKDTTSLELMIGPKWWIIDGLSVQLGLGAGLLQGYGTPDFRFVTGVVWAPARGN